MRRRLKLLTRCLLLGVVTQVAWAQWPPVTLTPSWLKAGGGEQKLTIRYRYPVPFTVGWDGERRETMTGEGTVLTLRAADLEKAHLATLTLYEKTSGTPFATIYVPVAYDVVPTGLAVHGKTGRIYVATPSSSTDPQFPPDSIIAIDANTGAFAGRINAGTKIGPLALSSEGSTLYFVSGGNTVQKVDTSRMTVTSSFAVVGAPVQPGVSGLAVMEGAPGTVALSFDATPYSYSRVLRIYDEGTPRAKQVSVQAIDGLVISPDGKYVFHNNANGGIVRLALDETGVGGTSNVGSGEVAFIEGDYLFLKSGLVLDWRTFAPVKNLGASGAPAFDAANNRALLLTGQGGEAMVQAYSVTPFAALGQHAIGGANEYAAAGGYKSLGTASRLLRFGTDGLVMVYPERYVLPFHTPLAGPAPTVTTGGVVSSASFRGGAIAPGGLVSVFGSFLGSAASGGRVGEAFTVTSLGQVVAPEGDVEVWFGRKRGTVLFQYSGQVNAIAPFDLVPGTSVDMQVQHFGIPSAKVPLRVEASAPALFTRNGSGEGLAAMYNQDGSVNAPAPRSSVVTLFGTGGGTADGAVDGRLAYGAGGLHESVRVTMGGVEAAVSYAGVAPLLVNGVFQINAQVPQGVATGIVPLVVTIGGNSSPGGVSIEIR